MKPVTLTGKLARVEPLGEHHEEALAAAAAQDRSIYTWSLVPEGRAAMREYIATALQWQAAGTAMPFAIVRLRDNCVIGSTRFFDLESWAYPSSHERAGRGVPDVGEIGYTWLGADALRTGINREVKLLLLTHAFESLEMRRICFHTDVRNERSAAALEGIGARFEGILRAHRLASDNTPRDSKRYAITLEEWPGVKRALLERRLAAAP